jgi:eukaryotic-like serine/threonine-protein kinase
MPLRPGTRLGPFEITGPLGAGGMGEVYRARDARLGRDVAVKCLPELSRLDPDRLARFTREAQALAALNHPHVGAIYGLEEAPASADTAAAQYLILELMEGGTLAGRIDRGPLPIADALTIARQIADALHAAHTLGFIHRDLKPGNIALTKSGDAKVLDFGLAKTSVDAGDAETMAGAETRPGTVLGTAAYMSPEQTRGLPLDRRSDIWAFGCVLFEMLTARQPFRGATVSDTTVAILGKDPDWSLLPSDTPPRILWLLKRCLERDPKRRLHDIADARIEIDEALAHPSEGTRAAGGTAARRMSRQEIAAWTIAALSIVALLAFMLTARRRGTEAVDAQTYRSSIVIAENVRLWRMEGSALGAFALSPDGRRLALIAYEPNGKPQLWVRPLDGSRAQLIPGTENASSPFWSPDSRSIGYLVQPPGTAFTIDRALMRVDLDGGQPVRLGDAKVNTGGTWNRGGVILFTPSGNAPIYRVAATGGAATPVTTLDAASGDVQHASPWFLPDGRHFLYSAIGSRSGAPTTRAVYLGSLDKSEAPRLLLPGALVAQYASGYLVFMRGATLFAQPFDPGTLQLSGTPSEPGERELVPGAGGGELDAFSVSANGALVYQPASDVPSQLVWFDRAGTQLGTVGEPADYAEVDLAPDGARAAVSVLDPQVGTRDLWIFDVARGIRERFTDDPGEDIAPVWSPTGDRLAFSASRGDSVGLYVKPTGGGGQETRLDTPGLTTGKLAAQWSADGRYLLFIAGSRNIARSDIWVRPFDARNKAFAFAEQPYVETQARLSPDGHWLALATNETGTLEVYVSAFPGPGGKQLVSAHGGQWPRWSRNGHELFFVAGDYTLMSTPIDYDASGPHIGQSRALFRAALRPVVRLDGYPYDVSPDGTRLLLNTILQDAPPPPLALVVNWPSAIKR